MKRHTVRVWDLPTRLFHWVLVAAIAGLFVTAYAPGAWTEWHARIGYAVLTLLLFRLTWGIVGGRWSRFVHFVPGPRTVAAYLRGQSQAHDHPGHNPLGALSVLAMLAILLAQVATGLVSDDEIAFTGPLNRFVSNAQGLAATAWHKGWGQWLIVSLVALHVVAIACHALVRGHHLVGPMLHGNKQDLAGEPAASRDDARSRLVALLVFSAWAAAIWLLVQPGPAS